MYPDVFRRLSEMISEGLASPDARPGREPWRAGVEVGRLGE